MLSEIDFTLFPGRLHTKTDVLDFAFLPAKIKLGIPFVEQRLKTTVLLGNLLPKGLG